MTDTPDLETELTRRAWTDRAFANQLRTHPAAALAALGVIVPEGFHLDIRVQRPDTLYYTIPPMPANDGDGSVVNQMDVWHSGDLFVWLMPETAKVALLDMRQQFRNAAPEGNDE